MLLIRTLALFILAAGVFPAAAQTKIRLRYAIRPPLVMEQNGQIEGTTASAALRAFIRSEIPFELVETPTQRQLTLITQNESADCAIGWFKNPERETFARFTTPISVGKPWVVLANKKFAALPHKSLAEWMRNKELRLIIHERFSYGPYIDQKIEEIHPQLVSTATDSANLVRMIQAGRVDYTFTSSEEAPHLIASAGYKTEDLLIIQFSEIPRGDHRYIMCSKQVSPEMIAQLNRALGDHLKKK